MGREITFPQVCEKGEPGGGGWTQAACLQQDTGRCRLLSLARSDGPKAPPEQAARPWHLSSCDLSGTGESTTAKFPPGDAWLHPTVAITDGNDGTRGGTREHPDTAWHFGDHVSG